MRQSRRFLRNGEAAMKTLKYMTEEDILRKGIDILMKELGPVETARFLSIPRNRRIESVKRHREWQKALKRGDFMKDVFGD